MAKSPFLVYQSLLTPEVCDRIADLVRVEPLLDPQDKLMSQERHHPEAETEIFENFKPLLPEIETYYEVEYRGTEHLVFQQFPVNGQIVEPPHCENAVYKRKKWVKIKDRDLTGILWLKDYKDSPPFDEKRQVLGGKLEFPVYNFGFQAQKGTLVIYPGNERFISITTPILVGELQCVRFHIAVQGTWLYDHTKFPGDFKVWFSSVV